MRTGRRQTEAGGEGLERDGWGEARDYEMVREGEINKERARRTFQGGNEDKE